MSTLWKNLWKTNRLINVLKNILACFVFSTEGVEKVDKYPDFVRY